MNLEIIAHRGFSKIAPENTLAAFRSAIQHSADSIEFDLQISADGVPIIFHDETLDRITSFPGKIKDKKIKQLERLDAGRWFSEEFTGEKIPTLTDAIDIFKSIKKYLYFDVKPHCQWSTSAIEQLIQCLQESDLTQKCIITSFNEQFLAQVRQACPEIQIGYFITDVTEYPQQLEKAKTTGNAILSSWYKVLLEHPHWVEHSYKQNVSIVAWTVDRSEHLKQLTKIGIERIITNSLIGYE